MYQLRPVICTVKAEHAIILESLFLLCVHRLKSFAVYACYNNIMILYPYMQLQMGSPVECLETVKNCMLQTQCQGMLNLPCGLSKQCMYTTLIHVFTHMAQTLQCYKTRGRRAHENNPAVHNMGIALCSLL